VSDWTLSSCQPLQNEIRDVKSTFLRKRINGDMPNGLKEGTIWHADLLLGNDRKTSNYATAIAKKRI
jgi:hypothetical protein